MAERLEARELPSFSAAAAREYELAADRDGLVEHNLRFGSSRVCVRVAGAGLAAVVLPALIERIDSGPGAVDATIAVWEAAACATRAVSAPWGIEDIGPGGLVRGPGVDPLVAVHETGSGALTLVDRSGRGVLHRVPDRAAMPWWELAAPLRPALFWALGGSRRHLVHAGLVGDDRGGVLLAGARGSGKTTVVYAALRHGLGFVADDYVLLRAGRGWEAVSVYSTVSLLGSHVDAKTVLDVASSMPGCMRESLPVRAVVLPRVRGGHAHLRSVSPAVALRAWAPSTALHMPFDNGAVVASLAEVVQGVPCFTLDVGDDEAELAAAVDRVLEQVRS
ncbi:MAG TPA: hypothetical protein VIY26_03375 [Acidimicrobiales bacterium]